MFDARKVYTLRRSHVTVKELKTFEFSAFLYFSNQSMAATFV
jgi:hypothetical protein